MIHVKIDIAGWEYFTGMIRGVEFVDGKSTRPLTEREINTIGANMRIVDVETNEQVGPTIKRVGDIPAPIATNTPTADTEETVEVEKVEEATVEDPREEKPSKIYTKEELEELAQTGGIKAIREIANEFGVKGVQISQLINGIINQQNINQEEK